MDTELHLAPRNDTGTGAGARADDSLLFIGNATTLIRYGGFTILTDPTFVHRHEKVDLGYGLSSTRLTDPAVEIDQLPPLDLILLSHFHGDHFDQVAQERLDHDIPIVTTPQSRRLLNDLGFGNVHELQQWETATLVKGRSRLRLTACPGRHGPGLADLVLPDVMGSVLQLDGVDGGEGLDRRGGVAHGSVEQGSHGARTRSIYISGDTLMYADLAAIPQRFPDLDLGLFHLGGTKVLGIMVTMDADQGIEAVQLVNPRTAIPIHYDDYDVFTSPLSDFLDVADRVGLRERIRVLQRGETFDLGQPYDAPPVP